MRKLFGAVSSDMLASVIDQSTDCVKFVGVDRTVQYMNSNGQCAMEIDDFSEWAGRPWVDMWPAEARAGIMEACDKAIAGETVRFDTFCPTTKGTARWWDVTVSPVSDECGRHSGFLTISRDVTDSHVARQALELAAIELRHRLTNTYQIIVTLIDAFAKGNPDDEVFAKEMVQRLTALGKAQSWFALDDAPCDISVLIPALMTAFGSPACSIVTDPVPATLVAREQGNAIALVLGELSVNSTKYGAMLHGGSIHLGHRLDEKAITLLWTEDSDCAGETPPRSGGQGLELIKRIVDAREGSINFEWHERGPRVTMQFDTL